MSFLLTFSLLLCFVLIFLPSSSFSLLTSTDIELAFQNNAHTRFDTSPGPEVITLDSGIKYSDLFDVSLVASPNPIILQCNSPTSTIAIDLRNFTGFRLVNFHFTNCVRGLAIRSSTDVILEDLHFYENRRADDRGLFPGVAFLANTTNLVLQGANFSNNGHPKSSWSALYLDRVEQTLVSDLTVSNTIGLIPAALAAISSTDLRFDRVSVSQVSGVVSPVGFFQNSLLSVNNSVFTDSGSDSPCAIDIGQSEITFQNCQFSNLRGTIQAAHSNVTFDCCQLSEVTGDNSAVFDSPSVGSSILFRGQPPDILDLTNPRHQCVNGVGYVNFTVDPTLNCLPRLSSTLTLSSTKLSLFPTDSNPAKGAIYLQDALFIAENSVIRTESNLDVLYLNPSATVQLAADVFLAGTIACQTPLPSVSGGTCGSVSCQCSNIADNPDLDIVCVPISITTSSSIITTSTTSTTSNLTTSTSTISTSTDSTASTESTASTQSTASSTVRSSTSSSTTSTIATTTTTTLATTTTPDRCGGTVCPITSNQSTVVGTNSNGTVIVVVTPALGNATVTIQPSNLTKPPQAVTPVVNITINGGGGHIDGEIILGADGDVDPEKDYCLAIFDYDLDPPAWRCVDTCILVNRTDNGTYFIGNTNHFSNFAVLLGSFGARCNDSSWYRLATYISLGLAAFFILFFILLVTFFPPCQTLFEGAEAARIRSLRSKISNLDLRENVPESPIEESVEV